MKKLLLLVMAFVLEAEDLRSLLEHAHSSNERILSKSLMSEAKESEIKSTQNSYFPTVDVGAFYQRYDDPNPFSPQSTYSGFATLGVDLYDGGKRSHTIEQKKEELLAKKYDKEATKKGISLEITEDFLNYKIVQAKLTARTEASNALKAQLERAQRFYEASLATSDDVSRLEAAYESNIYAMESLKFELLELKKSIELKVGKRVQNIGRAEFVKKEIRSEERFDAIEALQYEKNAILSAAQTVDSHFAPQIRLEDTFSIYGYEQIPEFNGNPLPLPENQNKIMATIGMRLFDFGVSAQAKEALRLSSASLDAQIAYQSKEQEILKELSLSRIKMAYQSIKSAHSGLKAAKSTFEIISKKYKNSIVDNIVYLDALSTYTDAKATHETSLLHLERSFALHYYYNSKKLEEFLQ